MASLLSRIQQSNDTTSTKSSSTETFKTSSGTDSSNTLTGSSSASLSDQIVGLLVMSQMSGSDTSSGATSGQSNSQSGQSGTDPISQAFSSLDADGDGNLSQSEMEKAITNAGGTTQQADAVYSALGGTSDTGISKTAFTDAAKGGMPPPPMGGPGGQGGPKSASDITNDIFSSLQTNQDGAVSDNAFASALSSASGGSSSTDSTSSASKTASAIDSNGDGSISKSELTSYLESMQPDNQSAQNQSTQNQSDNSTLDSLFKLASQSYSNAVSLFAQDSTSQVAAA
jgi:Ca2+-binding EF-hand superfamily protein